MKALSLWQPWASAIATGAKRIETRSWSTDYRGPLAIHAAKRYVHEEMIFLHSCWEWCAALAPLGVRMGQRESLKDLLPFGALVCVCDLIDCRPSESFTVGELDARRYSAGNEGREHHSWTERQMGDFSPRRFGWVLANVRPIKPVAWRGAQGLFNVELPA